MSGQDWDSLGREALDHFVNLLRIDTTNPPGNEMEAIRYAERVLKGEGIEPVVLESAPGRGNLVARLEGRGARGGLVLDAHLDTVPVTGQKWTRPPFEGKIIDGFVWGRGALDMKHMAAMSLQTMVTLRRNRVPLEGDVVLVLTSDEEAGGEYGIRWLAKHHPELLKADYALGEVGGMTLHSGGQRIYPIQVAEKGIVWVRLRIKGEPGHGSIPKSGAAPEKAAGLLKRLAKHRFPIEAQEPVRRFLETLGATMGFPASGLLKLIQVPALGHFLLRNVLPDRDRADSLAALLAHTVNPTVIRSDNSVNVIPSEVELKLDCRILPGTTPEAFLKLLRDVVGPGVEMELLQNHMGTSISADNDLYRTIEKTVTRMDPGALVTPYLISGFTNGHAYLPLGVRYMGFTPIMIPRGIVFNQLFHAADERCPVDGFLWGARTLYETVVAHLNG